MILGRVTGTVTATAKDAALVGGTLLIVAQERTDGSLAGAELVALDAVGAGTGDAVLVAMGSAARLPARATGAPVDATVIAIVDDVSVADAAADASES